MGTEPLNYWYDNQIRRQMMQVTRVFANLHYSTGVQRDGEPVLRRIPCRYASTNRQVSHILRGNSENTMLSVPMITVWLRDVTYSRNRVQEPFHVDKQQIWERNFDEETGEYGSEVGGEYTLERVMAVPYDLRVQVDVWTSNTDQKHQINEQIMVLFNPSIQMQFSENVFDWTALTEMMQENLTWSSRTVPVGTQDEIDITTWEFNIPMWISPPSILMRQKIIHTIVTNIVEGDAFEQKYGGEGYQIVWDEFDLLGRVLTTPGNHPLLVEGENLYLLGPDQTEVTEDIFSWEELFKQYGAYRDGISMIVINPTGDFENRDHDIKGTVEFTSEPNKLLWQINPMTLPQNTLDSIRAIINPHKSWPGNNLDIAAAGHRYLLTDDIGDSVAWGQITAKTNDIIEYDGSKWVRVFAAESETDKVHYLTNDYTGKQLMWDKEAWGYTLSGVYSRGFWRILL